MTKQHWATAYVMQIGRHQRRIAWNTADKPLRSVARLSNREWIAEVHKFRQDLKHPANLPDAPAREAAASCPPNEPAGE